MVELIVEDYILKSTLVIYITDIGGVEFVLDIQWLILVGTYSTNPQEIFLSFHQDGHKCTIKGLPPKHNHIVD